MEINTEIPKYSSFKNLPKDDQKILLSYWLNSATKGHICSKMDVTRPTLNRLIDRLDIDENSIGRKDIAGKYAELQENTKAVSETPNTPTELPNTNIINLTEFMKYPEDRQAFLLKFWRERFSEKEIRSGMSVDSISYNELLYRLGLLEEETKSSVPEPTVTQSVVEVKAPVSSVAEEKTKEVPVDTKQTEDAGSSLIQLNVPSLEIYFKGNFPTYIDKDKLKISGYSPEVLVICKDASRTGELHDISSSFGMDKIVKDFGSGFMYALILNKVD